MLAGREFRMKKEKRVSSDAGRVSAESSNTSLGRVDGWFARLQSWLQGVPNKRRPRIATIAGNLISDARYWTWRARGGTHDVSEDDISAAASWLMSDSNMRAYIILPFENTSTTTPEDDSPEATKDG